MDIGECASIHDLALRADYEQASATRDYGYEVDVSLPVEFLFGPTLASSLSHFSYSWLYPMFMVLSEFEHSLSFSFFRNYFLLFCFSVF